MRSLRGVYFFILFWRKKYSHLGVAPEPLAIWHKELEGLFLKSSWFFVERLPDFLVEKGSDFAVFGFFLSCGPEAVCLEEAF